MPSFAYQAVDNTGKKSQGLVDAADPVTANRTLKTRGLTVVKLKEGGKVSKGNAEIKIPGVGGGVRAKDLTLFSRQFATMIGSGLTILRSLMILEEQVQSKNLKKVISEIATDIEGGRSLSESMEKHPKAFDKLYVSMVKAGEVGGVLEMTLQRVASSLEARESLKRKIKSAMMYPTVVLIFAILAAVGMILFLVPVFTKMYEDLDSELPKITQLLVTMSDKGKHQPYLIPVILLTPYFTFRYWSRSTKGRRQWDRIKLRLPMKIGPIVQKVALARFSRTLSSLIASGVPMMQAVKVTGETAGNTVVEEAMDDILRSIEEGRTFSEPLKRHPIFPTMVIQMAAIGEETGKMDAMLEKVAEFYEDEVDAAIKSLTSIVEPIMMIFVGGIVGFIIIALYMPMFALFDKIK
ncbi:MAG: type secretion system family protein [Thermoleophilia bacterium]|nr:type secretion system family protein [Thermoleophilia bacterium]